MVMNCGCMFGMIFVYVVFWGGIVIFMVIIGIVVRGFWCND